VPTVCVAKHMGCVGRIALSPSFGGTMYVLSWGLESVLGMYERM
jgi:hypothetical protein